MPCMVSMMHIQLFFILIICSVQGEGSHKVICVVIYCPSVVVDLLNLVNLPLLL
jgi:hypothetical protein